MLYRDYSNLKYIQNQYVSSMILLTDTFAAAFKYVHKSFQVVSSVFSLNLD